MPRRETVRWALPSGPPALSISEREFQRSGPLAGPLQPHHTPAILRPTFPARVSKAGEFPYSVLLIVELSGKLGQKTQNARAFFF